MSLSHRKLLLFFLLGIFCGSLQAQLFKPFTHLSVLKTEHFDIIYPDRSYHTALRLAGFADEVYREVSSPLGIRLRGPIPVTITPDMDLFNGYMNSFPYPHIVLFDTPMDIGWTSFQDPLRSLFLHELTHALSLNSRGSIASFLYSVFGSWASPTLVTAPLFMVEGVTVSFESLDGFGRTNDPLVQQGIRQAVAENRALSPFQASGVYDLPPLGRAYYEYGGLFSAWLQKQYGMERYSELWKAMGTRIPLSLFFYNHGFAGIFKDTYGIPLKDAWQEFLAAYKTDGVQPIESSDIILQDLQIVSLAASDTAVYGIDSKEQILFQVDDPALGQRVFKKRLRSVPASAYDLSINKNQDRLLLSYYRDAGGLTVAVVGEYTTKGKATGREWTGLYRASYFRDGLVGISSNLHHTDLVFVDKAGQRNILARGNDRILFSKPVPIDDSRIAVIMSIQGKRRLALFNVDTGTFYLVKTNLADDDERWRYIRHLSVRENTLLFTYNHDHRFYKLGILHFDTPDPDRALYFTELDRSGGILIPVQTNSSILYRSAGSTWDRLARYQFAKTEETEAGDQEQTVEATARPGKGFYTRYQLEALDTDFSAALSGGNNSIGNAIAKDNNIEKEAVVPSALQKTPKKEPYNPVRYLNPLKFWLPVPLINNVDNSIRIDGMGIITYLMDPSDTNTILVSAGGDVVGKLGYFDVSWTSLNLGFPLFSTLSDQIESIESSAGYTLYRASRVSVASPLTFPLGDSTYNLHLMPSVSMLLTAFDPGDGSSAYLWPYEMPLWSYGINLGLSNMYRKPWQLFGNGVGLDLFARRAGTSDSGRLDATLRGSREVGSNWFSMRGTLYAAWDVQGLTLDGKNASFGNAPFADVAASEYAAQAPGNLPWVAGGEFEVKLFSFESQSNISHLYLNRFFGTLGYRWVVYETVTESNLQTAGEALAKKLYGYRSFLIKMGTVISATPITMAPLRYSPFFWGAVKLSNLGDQDPNNDFQLGFALSLEW